MKKITIALFAIMLTAGFVMAADNDDVLVTVTVNPYLNVVGQTDIAFALADGDFVSGVAAGTQALTYDVWANVNYNCTYTFSQAEDQFSNFVGDLTGLAGDSGVTKNASIDYSFDMNDAPGAYAATCVLTISQ